MTLRAFIRQHRTEIDGIINAALYRHDGNGGRGVIPDPPPRRNDSEREEFIKNDEGLYIWAKQSCRGLALALMLGCGSASAQSSYMVIHPHDLGIGTGRDVDIEESVETDGDSSTDEFVIADYSTLPARRAIVQVKPGGVTCTGPWENWFGDFQYLWPTYIKLAGLTRAAWTQPNSGQWIVMTLDTPACE